MRIDSRDCDISCLFVAADLQQLSEKELLAIFESEEKVFPSRMGQKFNAKAPESEKRKPEQKGEKRKTGESTVSFEEEKEEEEEEEEEGRRRRKKKKKGGGGREGEGGGGGRRRVEVKEEGGA